jgi:NADH:ubiquinone oxidoreductase subunit E
MEYQEIIKQFPPKNENLLAILHALQAENKQNYLAPEQLKWAASYLNTTLGHVYGVATYYSMYSVTPRGKHLIRLCKSPICHTMKSESLTGIFADLLGIAPGETTRDGLFTLEYTECLGQCGKAPVMLLDQTIYGGLTRPKIEEVINAIKAQEHGK